MEKVDLGFIKDWAKSLSKPLEELKSRYESIFKELVKNGVTEDEALEEAKSILFIEIKSEMQSSAEVFIGMVYGYSSARDWTSNIRAEALQKFKDIGASAVGKYVTIDDQKNVKPLWFNSKDEKKRTQILEPSLIRNVCGMSIKKQHFAVIEILNDIIANKVKKPEEYEADFNKWGSLKPEQAKAKLGDLWAEFKWFEMTISNDYADETKERYIKMPELFKPVIFRAVDKTDKQEFLALNSSSRTIFEATNKLPLEQKQIVHFLKTNKRFIKIGEIDKVFAQKSNYTESSKNKTQTTTGMYITEGSISSDMNTSPYSDILRLDDISLGFDVDKSVTLFLPKGMVNFGKGSRVIVVGQLTRKFDDKAKKYGYPSVQVSGVYVTKLVKVVTQEAIENIEEVKQKEPIVKSTTTTKAENSVAPANDVKGAVPLAQEPENDDRWGGL
jgi:hypothetical protein